jgi:hypothetical protein
LIIPSKNEQSLLKSFSFHESENRSLEISNFYDCFQPNVAIEDVDDEVANVTNGAPLSDNV